MSDSNSLVMFVLSSPVDGAAMAEILPGRDCIPPI